MYVCCMVSMPTICFLQATPGRQQKFTSREAEQACLHMPPLLTDQESDTPSLYSSQRINQMHTWSHTDLQSHVSSLGDSIAQLHSSSDVR